MRSSLATIALAACLALAALIAWRTRSAVARDLSRRRDLHGAEYAGSHACASCHPVHDASWRRTFHRTMTREASASTVLAPFDGRSLDWRGVRATMTRDASGAFWMTFTRASDGAVLERDRIDRTVGSRRYQQFLSRRGDTYLRLPVAWHIEEQRFFSMNDAFFAPDPPDGARIWPDAFGRYVARWNDNCVFCHNVGADPGRDPRTGAFHTSVAELGIACEACHGPGAEHARINRDPVRRYTLHLGDRPDPSIVNPSRLSAARGTDLCGRCHGQRIADDVGPFLAHGDPFVPGDDLARYTAPLWQDTMLGDRDDVFAPRFWNDGTARLTAYEYQGTLQSPCAARGSMQCTSCHGMHEGDPRGQLRPRALGNSACTQCHQGLANNTTLAAHTHHPAGTDAPTCIDCHMPRVVYGILDTHPSHRIESPDPARAARDARPDACTLCHVERSRAWAADIRTSWWPGADPHFEHDDTLGSETLRALFAGDPVERAIAADALGRSPLARMATQRARVVGALLETMRGDRYATVRHLAWRALRRLHDDPSVSHYDPSAALAAREQMVAMIENAFGEACVRPDASTVATLRARADERAIEVGE